MAAGVAPRVEPLAAHHDRAGFTSGVDPLDAYLRTQAGQDVRKRVATCFVLVSEGNAAPLGYYTLAAASVTLVDLPGAIVKRLPRYPAVPATLMGRLAVAAAHHGRRFGELLLFDAFSRALRSDIASFAFVVDAKDETAASFYARYRFIPLARHERRLFIPMTEIATMFA